MAESMNPLWYLGLAASIAIIPIAAGLATSYLKVSIVLGMMRSGLGAQQVPGNLVVMVLSLAMTFLIMSPVLNDSISALDSKQLDALTKKPSIDGLKALTPALKPWKEFLLAHSGKRELAVLNSLDIKKGEALSGSNQPETELKVLLPAFVLSEVKEAFAMGFVLLLPFLVIDLIVANILAGMGMFMVSPSLISLPLKLLLFLSSEGWLLLTQGLIQSYR